MQRFIDSAMSQDWHSFAFPDRGRTLDISQVYVTRDWTLYYHNEVSHRVPRTAIDIMIHMPDAPMRSAIGAPPGYCPPSARHPTNGVGLVRISITGGLTRITIAEPPGGQNR